MSNSASSPKRGMNDSSNATFAVVPLATLRGPQIPGSPRINIFPSHITVPDDIIKLFNTTVNKPQLISEIKNTSLAPLYDLMKFGCELPNSIFNSFSTLEMFIKSEDGQSFITRLLFNLGNNPPYCHIAEKLTWGGTNLKSMTLQFQFYVHERHMNYLAQEVILRMGGGSNLEFWRSVFKLAFWSYRLEFQKRAEEFVASSSEVRKNDLSLNSADSSDITDSAFDSIGSS